MQRNLEILDIPVFMSLGCSASEQAQPQKVLISLKLNYEAYKTSETSDNIEDALCYASLAEMVEKICHEKSYHLIEHSCKQVYLRLKERYPNILFSVRFHKVAPPHRLLQGGTVYTLQDENL